MGAFDAYMPRRKLRSSLWVVVALAVLASLLVLDISLYEYTERPGGPLHAYELRISSVEWFLADYLLTTGSGLNATASAALTLILSLTNCALFCGTLTIGSATTNTSGFAVLHSDLPMTLEPGATGNLSVTLSVPGTGYTGAVAVVLGH